MLQTPGPASAKKQWFYVNSTEKQKKLFGLKTCFWFEEEIISKTEMVRFLFYFDRLPNLKELCHR